MKNRNILIILCTLPLLAVECHDEYYDPNDPSNQPGYTEVDMFVREAETDKPVPFAEVVLTSYIHNWLGPNQDTRFEERFYTDQNGRLAFSFHKAEGRSYELKVDHPSYFYAFTSLNREIIHLSPRAWLRVNLINEPPKDTVYRISIGSAWAPRKIICCQIYQDTSVVGETKGNRYVDISFTISEGGESLQFFEEDIYIKGHDTTEFDFRY